MNAIAFSPDGTLVATANRDGTEQVWDAESGALRSQFNELRSNIRSIEFDRDSRMVVAAGTSGAVVVSDPQLGETIALLEGPRNAAWIAHFDPSARRVSAAAWDGTARIWKVASPYKRWSSAPVAEDCGVLASVVPDGRFLAATCYGFETRVWDTANDRMLAALPAVIDTGNDYSAFAAATAEGDRAAIVRGSAVEIYEVPGGKLLRTVVHPAAVSSVAFASLGHDMISGSIDGTVLVTRNDVQAPLALPMAHAAIDVVGFLSDGRTIDADASGHIRIFAHGRPSPLAELQGQSRSLLLRPSSDGRYLITIPSFRRSTPPELWDLTRYTSIAQLTGHVGPVRSARFIRGDSEILTAGGDGSVKRWETSTGRLLSTYEGGVRWLGDAVLDPSGTMVVAAGGEGIVRFWDAVTTRPLWTLPANTPYIGGLHYEGQDLVTRGFRGDIIRWSFPDPRQVIAACTTPPTAAGTRPACSALE